MAKFLIIFLYLFFMLFIGAIASKKIKNVSDYIASGKTLGFWLFVLLILGVTGPGFVAGWPNFWEQIFVPIILFGLYWEGATKQGGIWSMISGFIFGWYYKFVKPLPFHPNFYTFLISFFVMIFVSLFTQKTPVEILNETKTSPFIKC